MSLLHCTSSEELRTCAILIDKWAGHEKDTKRLKKVMAEGEGVNTEPTLTDSTEGSRVYKAPWTHSFHAVDGVKGGLCTWPVTRGPIQDLEPYTHTNTMVP